MSIEKKDSYEISKLIELEIFFHIFIHNKIFFFV